MPNQKITLFLLFFCVCFKNHFFSQVSSTSGPVSACAPANITFTAPAGASSISWSFGSFPPSTNATGNFNVATPTSFNAVFSGIVNSVPVTFTVPVVVHPKPVASFSIQQPSNSCAPKTVTLTDLSTTTSTLTGWQWVYGDGNTNTSGVGGSHTYTYTALGNWSITLIVNDVYGCDNQLTLGTVNVISPPIPVITSNPPFLTGCSSNFSAIFSASASVGTGLSYSWNFGNTQTSTQITTGSITFTSQPAQYPVTLTVTAGGCSAVTGVFVTVSPATLSVTVPSTVCLNVGATATVLSNQPYTSWDMGNSINAFITTPPLGLPTVTLPAYTSPGIYSYTVNAGNFPCLATPITHTVLVDQVSANFTTNPVNLPVSCNPTVAISFLNQSSSNAVNFNWTHSNYPIGAAPAGTLANPTMTFSQGSINPYTIYFSPFISNVTLVATSAAGCVSAVTHTVKVIERPTAWFNKDKKEGCTPLTVTFRDSSFFFLPNTITSYTWCNGAVPPQFVSGTFVYSAPSNTHLPQQIFTYTTAGVYHPYLIIKTLNGCEDISFIDEVTVADPPVVSFNFSPLTVCPNQPVQINNTTPNASNVQHWHVESDDGFFSGCVNDPNPSWQFTQVGTHTISLTGYQNGCAGTLLSPQTIMVKGPIVKGTYQTNCTSRMNVDFFSELQAVNTATLDFGDNSTPAVFAGNPTGVLVYTIAAHTYSASGNYTAVLKGISSSGCPTATNAMVVTVRDVTASFLSSTISCVSIGVPINASGSQDVYTGCNKGYVWLVDNLPPVETTSPFYNQSFLTAGIHTITLNVNDINDCSATVTHTLRVSDVNTAFTLNSNTVCLSTGTIQLNNTTTQLPDPVTSYYWSFGDGQNLTTASQAVITHSFSTAVVPYTTYSIVLTASNSVGCIRSATQTLQVIEPLVNFGASPQNICLTGTTPGTVTFTSFNSNASYTLNYGTGSSAPFVTTSGVSSYPYTSPGIYSVTMTVRTTAGCLNSGSIFVNAVQTPTADFLFNSPHSTGGLNLCSGDLVTYTNVSFPQPTTPTWNLGGGGLSNSNNIVTNAYNVTTTSVVAISLTVNTGAPAFCSASTTKNFTIYVTHADIALSKTVICLGEQIQLNVVNASGVSAWIWDFGDAAPSATVYANSTPPPTNYTVHAYTNYAATATGYASVSLLYWSLGEACRAATPQAILKIIKVDPDFKRNNELLAVDSLHCIRIPDVFNNTSSSNSGSLAYSWNFSNGFTSNLVSPSYTFLTAGVQQVSLTATGENNCKVSTVKNVTIFPLPTATISGGANCPDKPFPIYANSSPGVTSGTWSPQAGIVGSPVFSTSSSSFSISAVAASNLNYTLAVSNDNGCTSDPTFTTIYIQQPPPALVWDTTVIVGQPVPISAYEGAFTYTWTPVNTNLSCFDCYNPTSTSTVDITYSVSVEDTLRCSAVTSKYTIKVLPKSSVDVPTAFTPNGDGINDIIYVGGWGIKKLNYFRIFNRYGQLIFETNDLKTGWDGTYRSVAQNMETYVYQLSVDTYIDSEPLTKSATFKLIR